ncbi:GtrA family protein, partial [Clostridium beijerinckii]|nr:GtrA family protein [Clostridium beijerinckii]
MDNIVQKFKNTFYTKEFVTFLIIGVINTFNGTVFSYIYSS